MDTVGTFEMAKALHKYEMFTCLHKFYSVNQWKEQFAGKDHDAVHIYSLPKSTLSQYLPSD